MLPEPLVMVGSIQSDICTAPLDTCDTITLELVVAPGTFKIATLVPVLPAVQPVGCVTSVVEPKPYVLLIEALARMVPAPVVFELSASSNVVTRPVRLLTNEVKVLSSYAVAPPPLSNVVTRCFNAESSYDTPVELLMVTGVALSVYIFVPSAVVLVLVYVLVPCVN